MREKARLDVTDAELAVLKVLWDEGPATIRRITDAIYPGGETAHYATVQKLLERLSAKGCTRRRAGGRAHVWSASVERSDLIAHRLRDTADKLCEGAWTPLLTQLVSGSRLSEDEIAELRELVQRMGPTGAGRGDSR